MAFKQVSSWIVLVAMVWVVLDYAFPLFRERSLEIAGGDAMIGSVIAFIVLVVIGHIIVWSLSPKNADEIEDERDKQIELYGERAGGYALGAAAITGLVIALIDGDARMANIMFLGLAGSEIVKNVWQQALYLRDS